MLHFEGDIDFTSPPAVVWSKLTDAQFVVSCIPDVQSATHPAPDSAVCVIRPGFSFVRGTLELAMQLVPVEEGKTLKATGHGKGIGSSNDVEVLMTLTPHDAGTRIHWVADVTKLGGLLKAVPQGLLQGAAQKVIADVWAQVKERLDQPS